MALVSPGVEVTVIDESNYIPAATNSVPYFLIATAQNKISGAGVGVAAGTLEANAGKVYLITSQRDLAATFGVPFFYKTAGGTPINGYELNEYGLLAAYSALGISNRAYVQRANIDLAELTATLVRPTGAPDDNTYWLDLAETSWGIFQWNQSTGEFSVQIPHLVTNPADIYLNAPRSYVGSIGDYAVTSVFNDAGGTRNYNSVWYKNLDNVWVEVGSDAWKMSWPTVQGSNSVTGNALTLGNKIVINSYEVTLTSGQTLADLVFDINGANIPGVTAERNLSRTSNRLWLYADCEASSDGSTSYLGEINIDPSSTAGLLSTLGIDISTQNIFYSPALLQSYSYNVPRWRTSDSVPRPTGSVWNIINSVNEGMSLVVKRYDAALGTWITEPCPVFTNTSTSVLPVLDPIGGGKNIPVGTLMARINTEQETCPNGQFLPLCTTEIFYRFAAGATTITGLNTNPVFQINDQFDITYTLAGSTTNAGPFTVTLLGTDADAFATAVSAALPSGSPVSALVTSDGAVALTHNQGGGMTTTDTVGTPMADAGFNTTIEGVRYGTGALATSLIISHWQELDYISSDTAPDQDPADGRYWYYSATDQVDIMIQQFGAWSGYRSVTNDQRGYDLTQTDPNGPIISASSPTKQSDGTPLVLGDLWIDTSNLERYPVIKRWEEVNGVAEWVTIDNTDQTSSNGVLFADARWATNGTTDPITDPIPSITSLLTSNYLDPDAPSSQLYPQGILLFNTRRSGFNVKTFKANYFNGSDFDYPGYSSTTTYGQGARVLYNAQLYVSILTTTGNPPTDTTYWAPLQTNAWVTAAGNRSNGPPYMGRQAVRQLVVAAMKSAIDTQDTLREEQVQFNLLACPQYPELIVNMVALNNERSNTGFVVGDTPLRLPPTGTDIAAWATNTPGVSSDAEAGLVTSDPYLGVFYPSCQTTDLGGSVVVQPPSHMMVRTIIRNDEVAFPWLAPAGVRRGIIDNADAIGYVNGQTGEFVTIATGQGLRDTLYENKINPITFIPGVGITNYGNKTESAVTSALDRINVARLVAFIRGRLQEIGKTFVFEPNDQITRNEISNAIDGLMIDLVAKRGIYDYLIVCDDSNNTPARIDRNELWVDIAIEPVKAVEFIYIPLRIKNTGEIAAGTVASAQTV